MAALYATRTLEIHSPSGNCAGMLKLSMIGNSVVHVAAVLFHQDDGHMKNIAWVNSSCLPGGVMFKSDFAVIQGGAGIVSKQCGNKIFRSL